MRRLPLLPATVALLAAAGPLRAQGPVLLPSDALLLNSAHGGAPEMIMLTEEVGLVPYSGRSCSDASTSIWRVDGKECGDNEWVHVFAEVQQYGPEGRFAFEQSMQFNPPEAELAQAEAEARNAAVHHPTITRTVTNKEAAHGRILLTREALTCIEDQYPGYERTTFRSYAVTGTRIVHIRGRYNSGDAGIAERIHATVAERAGSRP